MSKIELITASIVQLKKSTRENWSKNIEQILEKNQNRDDIALLDDFLDDSDLEDFKW